jgi:hypothetical protein
MTKTLTALAAAATMTVAAVATPSTAEARRGWWGPAVVGAFAAAAIAGAYARPYYYAGYGYYGGGYPYAGYSYYPAQPVVYEYYPAYAPAYYYGPPRRVYYDCIRWRNGYRVRVC